MSIRRFFAAAFLSVQVLAALGCLLVLVTQAFLPFSEKVGAAYAVGIAFVAALPLYWLLYGDRDPGRDDYEIYALSADIMFIVVAMIGVALEGGDWAWMAIVLMVALWLGGLGFLMLANGMGELFYWAGQIFMASGLACAGAGMALYLQFGLEVYGRIFYAAGACFSLVYCLLVWLRFKRQIIHGGY